MLTKSENIKFNENQQEYVIQLKPRKKFPWWIFLFLLLLLLLIKCDRDIKFKVIDAENLNPVENTKVTIKFTQLENNQKMELSNNTDKDGKVSFTVDKKPVYKLLIGSESENIVNIEAIHAAYQTYVSMDKLGNLRPGEQIIKLLKGGMTVKIIDSITRKPLENAEVEAEVETSSGKGKSDNQGIAKVNAVVLQNGKELIITSRKAKYETTRKTFTVNDHLKKNEITIAMLSIEDGGMRGERGELNVNLKWNTTDDLDLIMVTPCNDTVYFRTREITCREHKGILDVDANVKEDSLLTNPQENIYWEKAAKGEYQILVLYYKKRNYVTVPFKVVLMYKNKKEEFKDELNSEKEFKLLKTFKFE